jgi:hypothetical protein
MGWLHEGHRANGAQCDMVSERSEVRRALCALQVRAVDPRRLPQRVRQWDQNRRKYRECKITQSEAARSNGTDVIEWRCSGCAT